MDLASIALFQVPFLDSFCVVEVALQPDTHRRRGLGSQTQMSWSSGGLVVMVPPRGAKRDPREADPGALQAA